MGGLFDRVTKLLGRDDTTVASVTTRGTKGAVATEIVDSSGNSISSAIVDGLDALNALVPSAYDYIALSYTGEQLTQVAYKDGGSAGTVVATLTLAYDVNKLISVTKT